jgi:glyoxylase-like metal-dependent hydrolase (beta-lactamase superfamily II)
MREQLKAICRRRVLGGVAATAFAASAAGLLPSRPAWGNARSIHQWKDLEALVVSDGHFFLPLGFLVAPDAPAAERELALNATGQRGEQLQLMNNITVIRNQSDVIVVDAGTGPRHQSTAGKVAENLQAAGIPPATITLVVLTHGHPDHLWGILDQANSLTYPNASYILSAAEWDLWADPDAAQKLPAALPKDRIVAGAKQHLARIKDKVRTVRHGDEIAGGVRVMATPGHTSGHISIELAGGDGLIIAGDALTHEVISFRHPSWQVPVDHEPDRGISTRLRLLDRLVTDKRRLACAHLPFPGTGMVERTNGAYRFVPT